MKRTELKRRTPLVTRTELRRTPIARKPFKAKTHRDDVPASVRRAVHARSGGCCEVCGGRAEHIHHRRLRSQGGRHELVNLLDVCFACHAAIHANPERSYALGLLVHGWCDPADVPVVRVVVAA